MKKELEKAVRELSKKAVTADKAHEAMQYTQAALNAMNAIRTLKDC